MRNLYFDKQLSPPFPQSLPIVSIPEFFRAVKNIRDPAPSLVLDPGSRMHSPGMDTTSIDSLSTLCYHKISRANKRRDEEA